MKAACLSGSSLRETAFGLRCSMTKPVQQSDQARPALIVDAVFLPDPGANLTRRPRQRLGYLLIPGREWSEIRVEVRFKERLT